MKTRHLFILVAIATTLLGVSSCKNQTLVNAKSPCSIELALGEITLDELMARNENNNPNEVEEIRPCEIPEQDPDANLEINVSLTNFSEQQEAKMTEALKRLKLAINSVEFRERVLSHTFNGEVTFFENEGMTNAEIYNKIMQGDENLLPEVDNEMDLDITMYYKYSSTVGYTYPNTIRFWVNSRFFNGFSFGQVAANAAHEWTHKLGYGHSFYNTPSRPYTVPYAIGGIISEIVNEM